MYLQNGTTSYFEKEKKTCLFKHDSKLCAPHITLIFHYKNSVYSSLIDKDNIICPDSALIFGSSVSITFLQSNLILRPYHKSCCMLKLMFILREIT